MPVKHADPFTVFEQEDPKSGRIFWVAKYQYRDPLGRLKPKKIERSTEKEARISMRDWIRASIAAPPSTKKMRVAAMMAAYLDRCRELGRREKTIEEYKKSIDGLINPSIGHISIDMLTASHVEAMMKSTDAIKWALNGRNLLRAAINKVIRKVDAQFANVAALAEPRQYRRGSRVMIAHDQLELAIAAETDEVWRAAWLMLAFMGMRPGEVRKLSWPELVERNDGLWVYLTSPKTEAGKIGKAVPKRVADALRACPKSGFYVFPSTTNKKGYFDDSTCRRRWRELQESAGLEITTLHGLRHRFASDKARKVKPHILQKQLGHADIRTTMQHYVTAFDDELREACEA